MIAEKLACALAGIVAASIVATLSMGFVLYLRAWPGAWAFALSIIPIVFVVVAIVGVPLGWAVGLAMRKLVGESLLHYLAAAALTSFAVAATVELIDHGSVNPVSDPDWFAGAIAAGLTLALFYWFFFRRRAVREAPLG